MSRIGKKPVPLPAGVTARVEGGVLKVKGAQGELTLKYHSAMKVIIVPCFRSYAHPSVQ